MSFVRTASRHFVVPAFATLALLLGAPACASGGDSGAESGGQDLSAASKAGLKKGEVCQLDDNATPCASGLSCASNCPKGAECFVSIFTCQSTPKPPVSVVGQGGVCTPGSASHKCDDGLDCVNNCPKGAECFVSIFTCQPPEKTKGKAQGEVCDTKPGDGCADGLTCKDNCPEGAKCFVSIFTCQPE